MLTRKLKVKSAARTRKMTTKPEETITITYSCTLKKSEIEDDPTDADWKDAVWEKIKSLETIDDNVVVEPNEQSAEAFKSFGGFSVGNLHLALKAEVCTMALLAKKAETTRQSLPQ